MTEAPRSLLAVLVCPDIEVTRAFYEGLGLSFVREQHGNGPEHYAARIGDAVLELYPTTTDRPSVIVGFDSAARRLVDPDGRGVLR